MHKKETTTDLRLRDSWPMGGVWVLEQLWRELAIDKTLMRPLRSKKKARAFERVGSTSRWARS